MLFFQFLAFLVSLASFDIFNALTSSSRKSKILFYISFIPSFNGLMPSFCKSKILHFIHPKVKGIPRQLNGSDCGVFTCQYAEFLSREASFEFSQGDMPRLRRRMAAEILQNTFARL